MVFEEFLLETGQEEPLVVILDPEQIPNLRSNPDDDVEDYYNSDDDDDDEYWIAVAANKKQLLTRGLLNVCSASRDAAMRFEGRPDEKPISDCYPARELGGLGLLLARDFFWVPDDMLELTILQDEITFRAVHYHDGVKVQNGMLSIHTVEAAINLTNRMREVGDDFDIDEYGPGLHLDTKDLFRSFHGLKKLVVMVDVPRQHVSWDKIQVVKPDDPALLTLAGETGRDRCLSVLRAYETWSIEPYESKRRGSDSGSDDDDSDGGIDSINFHNLQEMSHLEMIYRDEIASNSDATWNDGYENESDLLHYYPKEDWPQLLFGFLKPSSLPTSSPDIVSSRRD